MRWIILLLFGCAAAQPSAPVVINLAPVGQPVREAFTEVRQVKALPASVMKQIAGYMADPGKPFAATDSIPAGEKLPGRRLAVAGVSPKYCLIHFEQGGIAHYWRLALFKLSGDSAALVFLTDLPAQPGLAAVKAAVESGKLKDVGDHRYW